MYDQNNCGLCVGPATPADCNCPPGWCPACSAARARRARRFRLQALTAAELVVYNADPVLWVLTH